MSRDFIWAPSQEQAATSNVGRLMARTGFDDYWDLVRRSQDDPEWFWPAAIEDMRLEFARPWDRVVDLSDGPEWAKWFVGGELNVAWNCVHRWAERMPAEIAAVFAGEDGERRELTWEELSKEVTRLAEALASLGVRRGDVVAIFLPMSPEAAIASHACAHLGAIQMPVFSGFAAPAVGARLADSGAKVVVTADGSLRRGRELPMKDVVDEALREAPSVEHVVVWRRLRRDVAMAAGRDVFWDELVADTSGELAPLDVESETPYLLTYTSGTTGKPKGILHVQGGFLVSIAREVAYQADAGRTDVILFATDMGWIMGPWTVVGGGALGATLVFAEGAPDWPPERLEALVERERATVLGLSPTLVRALIPHGEPTADLSSLRTIVTTGEPWNPEPYRWLFEKVGGGRCPIINCSGGTEVGACFLSPTPAIPIKACSLGGPALGMAMDVVDAEGRPLRGEVGELVCRKPFPGMTRGIWRDPERYLDAYWRRLPGVWVHGDWASVDEDGYWFLHGRSDDTLNIAGKRIGPAEIESAVVAHPAVSEAAAVGVPHDVKGEVAWVFCVLAAGNEPAEELAREVGDRAAQELGKAFRPDRVFFVSALPKTRSAKIVRRAVRATALGQDPGDISSVENPEVLDEIARAVAPVAARTAESAERA
ncbi:MAG: AMP-binding protein [Actinobacteria bacterium]|nr:AMP-binding protein [Actinomycetota bacterium]